MAKAKVLASRYIFADSWLHLRSDSVLLPGDRLLSPCTIFEYPDWVDVIALTAELTVVLVDQYRHAVGQIRTEVHRSTTGIIAFVPRVAGPSQVSAGVTPRDSDDGQGPPGRQSAWRPRKRKTLPLSDSSSRGRPASTWLQNGLMFAPT